MHQQDTSEQFNEERRWARAAAWADGTSFGPEGHGVDPEEVARISRMRDRILEVGEDAAREEYCRG